MQKVKLKYPELDEEKAFGKYYFQPIASWYEKGTNWTKSIKYELVSFCAVHDDKAFYVRCWGKPQIEIANCGTESRTLGGEFKTCMCEKCVEGRKLVLKGWFPQ